MAQYIKGNIAFTPVVEQINRKFAPKNQTCTASKTIGPIVLESNSWMGAATRTNLRGGLGETRKNYFVFRENARKSSLTGEEVAARQLFVDAIAGSRDCLSNLTYIARMQQQYNESSINSSKRINGINAKGYTFGGWAMAVQYAGKKENPSYDTHVWPQNFD